MYNTIKHLVDECEFHLPELYDWDKNKRVPFLFVRKDQHCDQLHENHD